MAKEDVWDSWSVVWYQIDIEKAQSDDDIVLNPGDADPNETVRIVEIDGWYISACGGTQVWNTSEIDHIEVVDVSNSGSIN